MPPVGTTGAQLRITYYCAQLRTHDARLRVAQLRTRLDNTVKLMRANAHRNGSHALKYVQPCREALTLKERTGVSLVIKCVQDRNQDRTPEADNTATRDSCFNLRSCAHTMYVSLSINCAQVAKRQSITGAQMRMHPVTC